MAKKSWFNITAPQNNASEGGKRTARIDIFGEIGWVVSGSEFLRELRDLGKLDVIDLRIHSSGGNVLDGWAIANSLKNHEAKVIARIEGLAASMASVIACAADTIAIPSNAYMMIHNVAGGAFGSSDEMRSMADLIDKLSDDIANFYAQRTGKSVDEIHDMMAAETWMNGEDAVAEGFADVVIQEVAAAAVLDGANLTAGRFQHVPECLVNSVIEPEAEDEQSSDEEAEEETPEAPELPESEEEESAEEETEEEETESEPEGYLTRLKNSIFNRAPGDGSSAVNVKDLLARAESAEVDRDAAKAEVCELSNKLNAMEAEAKEVYELCAEAGFSPEAADDLPAPDDGDGEPTNVLDRYEAIEDAGERRKFFAAHKDEIWSETQKRAQAS